MPVYPLHRLPCREVTVLPPVSGRRDAGSMLSLPAPLRVRRLLADRAGSGALGSPRRGPLVYAWHMPNRKASTQPQGPRRARLFRNGRNQALRIPRELEFPGDEVILHKEDDRLIVEPVARRRSLAEILPELRPLSEDVPEAADPPARPEDVF